MSGEMKKQVMRDIESFTTMRIADIVGNVNPAQANAELCNLICQHTSWLVD